MKKLIYLFALTLLGISTLTAQSNFHNIHYLDPYNPEYVKGEVLIMFKDKTQVNKSMKSGVAKTGITSVDLLLEPYQIETVDKVFKETREQRQRKTVKTIRDFKGNEIEVPALYNIYKIKFDTIWDTKQIAEELQNDKNIVFAEPNYLVYTTEVMENGFVSDNPPIQIPLPSTTGNRNTEPDDPLYQDGSQWYLDAINAPAAWDSVTGDTTQIIAIIDTGVDWDHPDLDDNIWTNWNEIPDNGIDDDNNGYIDDTRGWDFVNDDNNPDDDNSHGTHVAGIAAAEGNNGIGMCGVAWNSKIMAIKTLQSSGSGNSSDFASSIEYASDNAATVINMSMGSYGESLTVKTVLENAYINAVLVAAAGNDGYYLIQEGAPLANHFPACYPFVLGVQASNYSGARAGFSNVDPSGSIAFWNDWGYNYELMAPGTGIISTIPNGNYRIYNGTSMASPIVSGICALVKSSNDTLYTDFLWAKLIFGTDNNDIVNAYNTLSLDLNFIDPDIRFVDYSLNDTATNCDNDGRADAGETINLVFSVKNVGGFADSTWVKVRFSEFEDTTTAVIVDSISYIGDLSTWAGLTGELDPILITFAPDVTHNRDVVFEYEIGCGNSSNTVKNNFVVKVENGVELTGMFSDTLTLTPDKLWFINGSFKITSTGVLNIRPGTELLIGTQLINEGKIIGVGKKDSLIYISGTVIKGVNSEGYLNLKYTNLDLSVNSNATIERQNVVMEFCNIAVTAPYAIKRSTISISDSELKNWNCSSPIDMMTYGTITRCNIDNISFPDWWYGFFMSSGVSLINNNFARFNTLNWGQWYSSSLNFSGANNILDSKNKICYYTTGDNYENIPNQYWGTSDSLYIEEKIFDFLDNSEFPRINFTPYLQQPTDSAHGCVWTIEINGIDAQDEILDPLGLGTYQFDVYFNKCMDISHMPLLGFGVSEPYLQRIINENSSWSADSTIWTAHYTIGQETGDGINTIRVQDAVDTAGFVIPVENQRFQFVIQAAGAASINFQAIAGIGKVELEWPFAETSDALGYNMYRFHNITDSTYSDTTIINTELIIDSTYFDANVIPDTNYHYMYSIIGTDMVESDHSKTVSATPFDAANGDANGDITVNVLDITSIVSYMLNQNPSPFLFDAADVNYDNDINVLDIIGLVQLINGGKSLSVKPLPEFSEQTAYYNVKDGIMKFESEGNVNALQFKLKVKAEKLKVERLEQIRIFSMQNGFEFAYSIVDNKIIGILFSLSAKDIPKGISELFRFEGVESADIEIIEIFGGNLNGDYVPVLKKGENASIIADEAVLQVNPNPFSNSTKINYTVPENGIAYLKIIDLSGAEIEVLTTSFHNSGQYIINWDGTNSRGQLLKSGIYLLQLKIVSVSGNTYNKETKVILIR